MVVVRVFQSPSQLPVLGKVRVLIFFAIHAEVHFAGAFGVVLGVVDDEVGLARDAVVPEREGDGGVGFREVDVGVSAGVLFDLGSLADFGGFGLEEGVEFFCFYGAVGPVEALVGGEGFFESEEGLLICRTSVVVDDDRSDGGGHCDSEWFFVDGAVSGGWGAVGGVVDGEILMGET